MKNTKLLWSSLIIVLIVIVIGVVYYYMSYSSSNNSSSNTQQTPSQTTPSTETPQSGEVPVEIKNFSFNPSSVTIKTGTKVTWTNQDSSSHKLAGDGIESGTLGNGQTFSKTFSSEGTFNYHCSIHPSMTGAITVVK